ncbi:MAG: DinB family protein, partial [Proteobacteria bacterium]|nr:DinB family protein [Pseudomonadota bacterium]
MATPVANLGRRIGELTNARISEQYAAVRALTEILIEPLSAEDACVQSMPDASPAKWHLAHVTWFFETFVLEPHDPAFKPFHPAFRELFNSYYNSIGEQYPRPARGMITRPSLAEVIDYRHAVDERIRTAIETADR